MYATLMHAFICQAYTIIAMPYNGVYQRQLQLFLSGRTYSQFGIIKMAVQMLLVKL